MAPRPAADAAFAGLLPRDPQALTKKRASARNVRSPQKNRLRPALKLYYRFCIRDYVMRNELMSRNVDNADASAQIVSRVALARAVFDDMRNTFVEEPDVIVSVSDAMVTVAAGRRAVQIQASEPGWFLLSFRRRHSFHMHPGALPTEKMAAMVESFMRER